MQKRFLFIEIGLFLLLLISWFFPFAYEITPWDYMTSNNMYWSWLFFFLVSVPMFAIGLGFIDFINKRESILSTIVNGFVSLIYAVVIGIYLYLMIDDQRASEETVIAMIFSLILFMYSFLIQKGTSYARNVVLCLMAIPILTHLFFYWMQLQYGGWFLGAAFLALVVMAAMRPFLPPKLD
ncbi:MAG: hypothetical protein DCO96_05630 [Fluviicola sp. XM-24bin1]|nr:MAG: hypothetical protein DCO96_05630 [Fluviicola sp. XM-24bin1]